MSNKNTHRGRKGRKAQDDPPSDTASSSGTSSTTTTSRSSIGTTTTTTAITAARTTSHAPLVDDLEDTDVISVAVPSKTAESEKAERERLDKFFSGNGGLAKNIIINAGKGLSS